MPHTLLVTVGSLGDLHPYLAMAKALLRAGDTVTVATHAHYRAQVERVGARFVSIPPSAEDLPPEAEWVAKVNDSKKGSEFVVREILLPFVERSYDALRVATKDVDRVVSHLMAFAVPLVAEKRRVPWYGCLLQPSVIFSVDAPPVLGPMPFLPKLRGLGPWAVRGVYALIDRVSRPWFRSIEELRRREGLAPSPWHPLVNAWSPHGNVALFPDAFAPRQKDWPENLIEVGFPLDDDDGRTVPEPVGRFLASGPPPAVFTLGSAVSEAETRFFAEAYAATKANGARAVFVAGAKRLGVPAAAMNDRDVFVADYVPYSQLFPRASVVSHQCGIGTTAQALAAGRPQLCVPFAHDQPDNAARVARLGAGTVLPAAELRRGKMTGALRWLLADARFAEAARAVSPRVRDGRFGERFVAALASLR